MAVNQHLMVVALAAALCATACDKGGDASEDDESSESESSSSTTRFMTSGFRSSSMSVQAAVPDVVWWPANIIEMNIPVIWSSL